MRIQRADTPAERVLVVVGDVGAAHVDELRSHLVDTLATGEYDVVLDARRVTSFADAAVSALVGAHSRAESGQHRFVVVDRDGGPVTAGLRRSGRIRLAVFPDVAVAHEALAHGALAGPRPHVSQRPPVPLSRGTAQPEDTGTAPPLPDPLR